MEKGERGYQAAYLSAIEELRNRDPKEIAEWSGAEIQGDVMSLEYLGERFEIALPGFDVRYAEVGGDVPLKTKSIILHYLKDAKGTPLSGKLIDFRGVPSGDFYYPVFQATVERPLLEFFGDDPRRFVDVSSRLGAEKAEFGDFSVKIPVFPKVPMIFIIYAGDDEFPPSSKVLFDSSVQDYLTVELVRIVCEEVVRKLIKLAEEESGDV